MTFKITSLAAAVLIIAACHSSKKASTATASTPPPPPTAPATPANPPAGPTLPPKSSKGIYEPGNEELTAVLTKFPDATLPVLKEGYLVYTGEACTGCHGAKGIYRIPEKEWPHIILDMGGKAKLTPTQIDALTKFVFAIKATQPPPSAK
ncbi:MAG: hypothetical protein V4677_15800 [Bacteroidota bacterium]